jgi:undecaprenyl-diphosphatase
MDIIYRFDFAILDALQKIHCTFLNCLLAFFTYIGEGGAVWIAAAVIMLICKKYRKAGCAVSLALLFELIFNEQLIKKLIKRTRPFILNPAIDTIVHRPSSYSFPSGHTCTAFAAATAIFLHDKKLGTAAYITAAVIGFSRNYFYIHYPTDVLCGAAIGIIFGVAAVKTVHFAEKKISCRD